MLQYYSSNIITMMTRCCGQLYYVISSYPPIQRRTCSQPAELLAQSPLCVSR